MSQQTPRNPSNARTAVVLLSVAFAFFLGVFGARLMGVDGTGLFVLGFAMLGFLVVAIGRNLWRRR